MSVCLLFIVSWGTTFLVSVWSWQLCCLSCGLFTKIKHQSVVRIGICSAVSNYFRINETREEIIFKVEIFCLGNCLFECSFDFCDRAATTCFWSSSVWACVSSVECCEFVSSGLVSSSHLYTEWDRQNKKSIWTHVTNAALIVEWKNLFLKQFESEWAVVL